MLLELSLGCNARYPESDEYEVGIGKRNACGKSLTLTQQSKVSPRLWIKFVLKHPHWIVLNQTWRAAWEVMVNMNME